MRRKPGSFTAPSLLEYGIGLVTNFFDALEIGSFATTRAFRIFKAVRDEQILGTLNAGAAFPGTLEAFIYIAVVKVDAVTLVAMIAASVLGFWLGAGRPAWCSREASTEKPRCCARAPVSDSNRVALAASSINLRFVRLRVAQLWTPKSGEIRLGVRNDLDNRAAISDGKSIERHLGCLPRQRVVELTVNLLSHCVGQPVESGAVNHIAERIPE